MKKNIWKYLFLSILPLNVFGQELVDTIKTLSHENLGPKINSKKSELTFLITANGKSAFFVRDGHPQNWSEQDVWFSTKDASGNWIEAVHLGDPVNSRSRNGGIFAVSVDENELLIRGAFVDGEYESAGISKLTKTKEGKWGDPQKLDIINFTKYSDMGSYNTARLSNDGKYLLYSFSDKNQDDRSDIYYSELIIKEKWGKGGGLKGFGKFLKGLLNNNSWTEPRKIVALSPSESSELGPYLASDGVTLYFSSNRKGGYGSNDIWMSRRLDDTWQKWSEPVNLGPRVNSSKWESYYVIDAKGEYGYLASSQNSYGEEDVVRVKLAPDVRPKPVVLISGKVYNAKTKEPMQANIEYENLADGQNAGVAVSNASTGEYRIVLPYGKNYGFMAYASKFIAVSDNLDLTTVAEYKEIERDLYLVPLEVGSTIRLNNIFFDTGKDSLRSESFPELDRLVGYMNQNGKMQIELSGHTDNVGSDDANLKLSDDRAKAVTRYLVSKGIKEERIIAKGYGETKPVATNETDEGRQLNRRVEFTILKN